MMKSFKISWHWFYSTVEAQFIDSAQMQQENWKSKLQAVPEIHGTSYYLGIEPMTGMLLSRTSWRLYYETGHCDTKST